MPIDPHKDCIGCEQDFYNDKNPYGVKQCWSVPTAKIVSVVPLSIDQPSPEDYVRQRVKAKQIEKHPHCYQRKRMIYVKKGHWGWA